MTSSDPNVLFTDLDKKPVLDVPVGVWKVCSILVTEPIFVACVSLNRAYGLYT
jgi:hypothetical protein